jgi:hypothetical protein
MLLRHANAGPPLQMNRLWRRIVATGGIRFGIRFAWWGKIGVGNRMIDVLVRLGVRNAQG